MSKGVRPKWQLDERRWILMVGSWYKNLVKVKERELPISEQGRWAKVAHLQADGFRLFCR